MSKNLMLLPGVVALVACVAGCGERLASLEGTVTIDGKPAPAGIAFEFAPSAGGSPSYGTTDASGHYEAAYTFKKKGIEIGEHTVKLLPSNVETGMPVIGPDGKPVGPEPEDPLKGIPQEYYQQIEKITVEAGANTHDIALTTGKP